MNKNNKQNHQKADVKQLMSILTGKTTYFIPHNINILGQDWAIKIDNDIQCNGLCDHVRKTIFLKKQKDIDRTLLHEVLHARDRLFGWKINSKQEDKEALVRIESELWRSFMKQVFPLQELGKSLSEAPITSENGKLIKTLEAKVKRQAKQIEKLKLKLQEVKNEHN